MTYILTNKTWLDMMIMVSEDGAKLLIIYPMTI